jgi:hypothetical protein
MIPAYSPQARGRMERSYGTWQGRLPQELRLAGSTTLEAANRFLHEHYIHEFNAKFTVPAAQKGTAFHKCARRDPDWVFSIQTERVVEKDNTVAIKDCRWQIEKCRWRHMLAGQTVTIHQHLKEGVSIRFGPHVVGHYIQGGGKAGTVEAVENQTLPGLPKLPTLPMPFGGGPLDPTPPSSAVIPPLMVRTNSFLYYDPFEQMLAIENAGALLKPGGLLLTNNRLPEVPDGSICGWLARPMCPTTIMALTMPWAGIRSDNPRSTRYNLPCKIGRRRSRRCDLGADALPWLWRLSP